MGQITESRLLEYGFKREEGPHVTRFTIADFCILHIREYDSFRIWPNFEPIENEEHLKSLFTARVGKSLEPKAAPTREDLTQLTPEALERLGFKKSERASCTVFWIEDSEEYEFVVVQYHDDCIFRHRENHGVTMSTISDLKTVYFQETGENL